MTSVASRRHGFLALLSLAALLAGAATPLLAQDSAALARDIGGKWSSAVVAVRVVAKMRVVVEGRQMDESERVDQIRATVIDPSGLAVCSLSEIDPSRAMDLAMEEEPDYQFEAEITDVKMLLADGEEIPGKVILRDRDLDLAFIRPAEAPAEPMASVDLTQDTAPEVLDEVVVLGRLGDVGNRAASLALDRVQAIVTKPRTFYVTGLNTWMAGLGCPVFALDGKAVGVLVVRSIPGSSSGSGGAYGDSMPVILPCDDILEVAQQAPEE